ncbi:MAG: helix-turn-helix domain-containing protein [Desulfobulbaceae bacterium]|nr:helix-turn-helix domain-containing protein [Desulfobulbaceae bacterium]
MPNHYDEILKATSKVPKNIPAYLSMLTTAGHLHAAGYDVQESALHEDGFPCRALIFAPILIGVDGNDKIDGHLQAMFEIRVNILLTIQEAAEECGVGYRTIQRWRDEKKIPVFTVGD